MPIHGKRAYPTPCEHLGTVVRQKRFGPVFLTEIDHPAAGQLPVHVHQRACFTLVLSGAFQETFGLSSFDCRQETLLYRPPGIPHSDVFSPGGATAFLIEPDAEWMSQIQKGTNLLQYPRCIQRHPALVAAFQMRREWNDPDDVSDLVIGGLMLQMAGHLQRACREERSRIIPFWLKQTRDLLHGSFTKPPTLSELAAVADVHPVHLAREFRRAFHHTPGEYVRRLRVASACRLLSNTQFSLLSIAEQTGFANQSHFTRTFHRIMATTPGQYRECSCTVRTGAPRAISERGE